MAGILDFLPSSLMGGGSAQDPSFLSRIADGLSRNSGALTGFGMGLMSGASDPENGWRNAAMGYQAGIQNDQRSALLQQSQSEKLAKQKAAAEFAKRYPQYGAMLATNPDMAETFAKAEFQNKLNPEKPSLFERMTPEQQQMYLQRTAQGDTGDSVDTASKLYTLRMQQAKELGIRQDDPRYASFVGTGKMPREDAQPLSATDKKAIMEADEGVMAAQTAIQSLQRAKEFSAGASSLPLPDFVNRARAWFGNEAASNTVQMDNEITTNALSQLKSIFGGAPTEGERKLLLDIQGSSSLPHADRVKIFERAERLAQTRLKLNQDRSNELRGGSFYRPGGGSFYRPGGGSTAAPAAPPAGKTSNGLSWGVVE